MPILTTFSLLNINIIFHHDIENIKALYVLKHDFLICIVYLSNFKENHEPRPQLMFCFTLYCKFY